MGKSKKIGVGLGVLGFFIFAIIAGIMIIQEEQEKEQEFRNMSLDELEKLSVYWDHDDIVRNVENYEGKIIRIDGKIFRVESNGTDRYILTVRTAEIGEVFFVEYTGSRVLPQDKVRIYGIVEKIVEVESMTEGFTFPYPYVKAMKLSCIGC